MEDLARLSFKRQPIYVGVHDSEAAATREGLEQGYCVVGRAREGGGVLWVGVGCVRGCCPLPALGSAVARACEHRHEPAPPPPLPHNHNHPHTIHTHHPPQVPADKRFLLLFTFLKKNLGKKVGG